MRLSAAAAYLLALAVGSLSHDHLHRAHQDGHCGGACADIASHIDVHVPHDGDGDHDDVACNSHVPAGAPAAPDDDCSICRFLGRPILLVTPFELADACCRVAPLALPRVPRVQPAVIIVAQARAPPQASLAT